MRLFIVRSTFILVALLLFCDLGWAQDSSKTARPKGGVALFVFFKLLDPLEFLDTLKTWHHTQFVALPAKGWIKESHIPELIQLLDCRDSCANVMHAASSFMDFHRSTIAHEAAYLIAGFRAGEYPPGMNSSQFRWAKDDILLWWEQYKAQKVR